MSQILDESIHKVRWMDGWVDGWMGGLINGMDGWASGWMDGQKTAGCL